MSCSLYVWWHRVALNKWKQCSVCSCGVPCPPARTGVRLPPGISLPTVLFLIKRLAYLEHRDLTYSSQQSCRVGIIVIPVYDSKTDTRRGCSLAQGQITCEEQNWDSTPSSLIPNPARVLPLILLPQPALSVLFPLPRALLHSMDTIEHPFE